jgi:hypothetical protein
MSVTSYAMLLKCQCQRTRTWTRLERILPAEPSQTFVSFRQLLLVSHWQETRVVCCLLDDSVFVCLSHDVLHRIHRSTRSMLFLGSELLDDLDLCTLYQFTQYLITVVSVSRLAIERIL